MQKTCKIVKTGKIIKKNRKILQMRRKSVPNTRQQGAAFGGAPKGRRASRVAPLGFVVLYLVRVSYAFALFGIILCTISHKFSLFCNISNYFCSIAGTNLHKFSTISIYFALFHTILSVHF